MADAHTARTRFHGATQEAEDCGALVPNVQPPDEGQFLSEKKHRVGGMRFLTQFGRGILGASVIGGGGYLAASAVRVHGQTAPHPGVRLALLPDVQMRDYPRRATVAIPRPKALRLEAENRGYRVRPPVLPARPLLLSLPGSQGRVVLLRTSPLLSHRSRASRA